MSHLRLLCWSAHAELAFRILLPVSAGTLANIKCCLEACVCTPSSVLRHRLLEFAPQTWRRSAVMLDINLFRAGMQPLSQAQPGAVRYNPVAWTCYNH